MRIVGLLQVRNEMTTGHLERFLDVNSPLLDVIYAYDDSSTDGTFERLTDAGASVIRGSQRAFGSELLAKNLVLDQISRHEANDAWIFRLDADEVCFASRDELEELLMRATQGGFDSVSLPHLNLWKSTTFARVDDKFDTFRPVRLWKNWKSIRFPERRGLHITSDPNGLNRVQLSDAFPILHFGFATNDLILDKAVSYWNFGQRGYPLFRLLLDQERAITPIGMLSPNLGERWDPPTIEPAAEEPNDQRNLIEFFKRLKPEMSDPSISLISLIFNGVDWLEFQYAELLRLAQEFPSGEVEILFVANDPSPEVHAFLRENKIPHVVFEGRASQDEWYINSVYRAYNHGVKMARGETVLLVNSDMSYCRGFLSTMLASFERSCLMTARLIESGKLSSGELAIERDFGSRPGNFRRQQFLREADKLRTPETAAGGLYMPLMADRSLFLELGGFPEGNIIPSSLERYLQGEKPSFAKVGEDCVPGDRALFELAEGRGISHRSNLNAIAYHFQEGEIRASRSVSPASRRARRPSGIALINDEIGGLNGEEVFWEGIVSRVRLLGIGLVISEVGRPATKVQDFLSPWQSWLRAKVLFSQVGRPRVVFQNATYQLPVNALRTAALIQDQPVSKRLRLLRKLVLSAANSLVTNDAEFFRKGKGLKMTWIPIPLAERWKPRPNPKPPKSPLRVCFVGALNETKGWPQLRSLILSSPEFRWTIISKYSLAKDDITPAHAQVLSNLSATEMDEVLADQDVVVVTSPKETQHLAALEAMSRGVRVVSTPTGYLGNLGVGTYSWGVISEAPSVGDIRAAGNLSFEPALVFEELGLDSHFIWDRWINFLLEELEKSFLEVGEPSAMARFVGRVKSAVLDIWRRSKRVVLSKLLSFVASFRPS